MLILVVAAAEIGYALIYRMTVLYRGIRHRIFWIIFNIVCFLVRAGMLLMMTGVISDATIRMLPLSVLSVLRYFADISIIGICYAVLVARDIGIWLSESKNTR